MKLKAWLSYKHQSIIQSALAIVRTSSGLDDALVDQNQYAYADHSPRHCQRNSGAPEGRELCGLGAGMY